MSDDLPGSAPLDPTRQRRIGDAGRLVPVLAAVLILVPTLWAPEKSTASALIYVFAVWALLIVIIAALSRALGKLEPRADDSPPET